MTDMLWIKECFTVILFLGIFPFPIFGQSSNRGISEIVKHAELTNTYALIIGISNYLHVENLEYADRDAQSFAAFLQSKSGGSVDNENILVFLNEEATAINIGLALEKLGSKMKSGDKFIFYFAGHGDTEVMNKNNGLLLLHKAPNTSYFAFGDDHIKINEFKNIIKACISSGIKVQLIVDACKSGKLAGGESGAEATGIELSENWFNETKILSCQPHEISLEGTQWGGGHGVFTFYLVAALYGLADDNKDGRVSLMEVEFFVRKKVLEQTYPVIQTPLARGDLHAPLSLVHEPELLVINEKITSEIPLIDQVNTKGITDQLNESPDTVVVDLYKKYLTSIDSGNLINPEGIAAIDYYSMLEEKISDEQIVGLLKRNLVAALQEKAMDVITPIVRLESLEKKPVEQYLIAADELNTAIQLLGEFHFLTKYLQTRSLFLEAYALCEQYDQLYSDKKFKDSANLIIAKEKLLQGISIDSNAAYCYFQLGWIFIRLKKINNAFEVYNKYVELVPNNKRAYNNLGLIYLESNMTDLALEHFKNAIKIDSNYARPYDNIGYMHAQSGNLYKATEFFQIAVNKDSTYVNGLFNLGLAHLLLSNFEESVKIFEKIISLEPEYFDAHYYLSEIYSTNNESENAIYHLRQSLELGLDDYARIKESQLLENIRKTDEYKDLIKKYF